MKIEYIAIIFIIIILPITITLSSYINSQIDTISLQNEYNTKLINSTYDAIKAFQINTANNRYSSVSNSKIRDLEAAVNTFYTSLSNNEQFTEEELKAHVPALVFTLYDGYYIYTRYDNRYPEKDKKYLTEDEAKSKDYYYGLKPYIYYSCRYKKGENTDFVVNYTLDNAITIYGTFDKISGTNKYKTLSGYLINPNSVNIENYQENPLTWKLTYGKDSNKIEIGPEHLTEHLLFADKTEGDYDYLVYNGQKIYYDKSPSPEHSEKPFFWYQNYGKTYINDATTFNYASARLQNGILYSTSSFEYYYNAKTFSDEVIKLTDGITQANAVDENGNIGTIEFSTDTGNNPIFKTDYLNNSNDPLLSGSTFNENRISVIRRSIETNLSAAIANFSEYSSDSYDYSLPVLNDIEWDKITNNVSLISFLQGISIGNKIYNNYCVITNNSNEEVVKKEDIYIVTENSTGREYHLPGCHHLMDTTDQIVGAYSNLSFVRQNVRLSEEDFMYFYPQMRGTKPNKKFITSCYYCIVNASSVYGTDEIIKGTIQKNEKQTITASSGSRFAKIRELYIKALARERYDLYQANIDSFNTH